MFVKKSSKVLFIALLVLLAFVLAAKWITAYSAKKEKMEQPPVEHTYETDGSDFSNIESQGDS